MRWLLMAVLTAGVTAGGYGVWSHYSNASQPPAFRTVPIEHGNLAASISATGTLEPEEVVDIGAQVAGMIKTFGTDPRDSSRPIDFGTPVEEGTVLARIDDSIYKTQVEQARATVQRAEADLAQMQAKLVQTERDWNRAKNLNLTKGFISGLDFDTAQAVYETAKSALGVGVASVEQAKAAQRQAEINLGYCTIKSPVKGVIVDRRVNVGQTVVSSLNAPSLFLLAKDLRRMQIWASVNEADIGQIHQHQVVRFTVDAYPNEVFQGEVAQVRLNATMTQNVVTYTVVVNTDNSTGKLLPYLTANLQFEVDQRSNVLLVPNAALRWRPTAAQVAPELREAFVKAANARREAAEGKAGEGKTTTGTPTEGNRLSHGTIWIADGQFVRPAKVRTGLTDGVSTEIVSDAVQEGQTVVTGIRPTTTGAADTSSPFAPQMFGKKS